MTLRFLPHRRLAAIGAIGIAGLLSIGLLSCAGSQNTPFFFCGGNGTVPPGQTPIDISRSVCPSGSPSIARSNGVLSVAWLEQGGGQGIYVSRSIDNGNTFSSPVNISGNIGTSESPINAADGSDVFVVWDELFGQSSSAEVFLSRSTDGGVTFANPVQISSAGQATTAVTATHSARSPAVAVVGKTVWVAWEDDVTNIANINAVIPVQSEILASVSTDGGVTFTPLPTGISFSSHCLGGGTTAGMFSHFAFLSVSGNNVYAIWQENTPIGCKILPSSQLLSDVLFSQAALAAPTVFSSPVSAGQVAARNADAAFGVMAVAGSTIHIVWSEGQGNSQGEQTQVFYTQSIDGGVHFSTPKPLSGSPQASGRPSLAASGTDVLVVWEASDPQLLGIDKVTSTDGGATFGSAVNVPASHSSAQLPKVLLNSSDFDMVWLDSSLGSPQVVFQIFPF